MSFSRIARALPLLLLALATSCSKPVETDMTPIGFTPDPHSFARPDEAHVTNVSLDLRPDFKTHQLHGVARLAIARAAGADSVVLDTRDLMIASVTGVAGDSLHFFQGAIKPFMGQPLTIALPAGVDTVVINYTTSPDAAAVQWLAPAQTAGKKLPFMFTQGEAILTRTWIPTQDSPGIRQTYDAVLHVPANMVGVMSAENLSTDGEIDSTGAKVFRFKLDKPVPPYLIALAVGDIGFIAIGDNTGVYAEPSVVERAAREFSEVDQMVATAARLYGPYRWGRYDILVLPPSFPFGGMENPMLTFATPTVLAGDKSLVSLVAHELAHSWSGNLVTNASWNDFWLNEGFTTYIEYRIMEELRGKDYSDMLGVLGRQELDLEITGLGGPTQPDTRLHADFTGRDPDDGMTNIAYEKGALFLKTVESAVGRERLDLFLRDYFDTFAYQPMTSERLVAYMKSKLFQGDEAEKLNVQAWVFEPGIPANATTSVAANFLAVDAQVTAWKGGASAASLTTSKWSTHEWLHFLNALSDTIPAARLQDLDAAFKLTQSNSEIQFAWFQIAIRNKYEPTFAAMQTYLLSQGRRKLVRPLYESLSKTPWGMTMATNIYRRARPLYHSVTTSKVDPILKWEGTKP